jgi:type I restriction enzyme S subunit
MKGGQSKWPAVTLGEVCEFKYGKSLPESARAGGEVPVYGSNGEVGRHCEALTDGPTIVIGRKGSYGEINYSPVSCWPIDTTYYVDHTSTKADLCWLAYRLSSLGLNKLNKAAAVPGLNREDAYRQRLLLPPIQEQRRIAEILDKADALRAKRRTALAQLDTLTRSIFLDMFGDPAMNPKGWPERTIGDLCEVKGGKRLPKGEEYSSTPTPFRYIRVTDLKSGRIDESALVYLKPEIQAEISRYVVNTGDVVISIAGSIGLIAPVPDSLDGVNLTENAAKLVPRSRGVYDPIFLSTFLQTPFAQSQIGSHIGQVTIGKLALFRIEKIKLPLPPMEAQHKFACCVEAVQQYRNVHRSSMSGLETLFGSLQHSAFRGEL